MNQRQSSQWRVLKFGGSSVSRPAHWEQIARRVTETLDAGRSVVVVVSAIRGITDLLEARATGQLGLDDQALIEDVRRRHVDLLASLELSTELIDPEIDTLAELLRLDARDAPAWHAQVIAMGEMMSSRIGTHWLADQSLPAEWLDPREFLISQEQPHKRSSSHYLSADCPIHSGDHLKAALARRKPVQVMPGFIAANARGETVVLGRGGSDTSATLIAAMLDAERVEIHSDVPGLFTADPRRIPAARLLKQVSYREAQELAAMGARALHPRSLIPARDRRIPLWLRQTDRPDIEGTRISADMRDHGAQVKAIVQRKGITLISLEGLGMWQQVGFLADVFAEFKTAGLSVDQISTSESNVTLTLDPGANLAGTQALDDLVARLEHHCRVEVMPDCATVSLVGLGIRTILHRLGPALEVFEQRRIYQVSQAANDLNLTFVVESRHADRLVQQLHQQVIPGGVGGDAVFGPSWEALFRRDEETEAVPAWWRSKRDRLTEVLGDRDSAYVYDLESIRDAARRLVALPAVDRVLYSMKANPHAEILRTACANGLGIECVSLAEARHALASVEGLNPADLLFTPNFAPRREYRDALELGLTVTLDNPWILEHWGADFAGRSVFLRLDPGSGLGHHKMVRTAGSNAKFGVPLGELERVARLARAHDVAVTGLHAHTGSGIMHPDNWHRTLETLGEAARELPDVEVIDVGGGLGVPDRETDLPLDLAALEAGIAGLKSKLVRPR